MLKLIAVKPIVAPVIAAAILKSCNSFSLCNCTSFGAFAGTVNALIKF